jgi:hypothetical protein
MTHRSRSSPFLVAFLVPFLFLSLKASGKPLSQKEINNLPECDQAKLDFVDSEVGYSNPYGAGATSPSNPSKGQKETMECSCPPDKACKPNFICSPKTPTFLVDRCQLTADNTCAPGGVVVNVECSPCGKTIDAHSGCKICKMRDTYGKSHGKKNVVACAYSQSKPVKYPCKQQRQIGEPGYHFISHDCEGEGESGACSGECTKQTLFPDDNIKDDCGVVQEETSSLFCKPRLKEPPKQEESSGPGIHQPIYPH